MVIFYSAVLNYIRATIEEDGAIEHILELAKKAFPSWKANEESVSFLEKCCNRNSSVKDEDEPFDTINGFVKAAFKDLSVLKDPAAMRMFDGIASLSATYRHGDDILIWARNIKIRDDGSAVVILHVSNIERFRELIEKHDLVDKPTIEGDTLEDVVLIGS